MPARERWSRENAGIPPGSPLHYSVRRGGGHGFSYLLESHMIYLRTYLTHPQELARNTVKTDAEHMHKQYGFAQLMRSNNMRIMSMRIVRIIIYWATV
jgi:hypothetical protein